MITDIEHGTSYAAYQRCRRANPDGPCKPCKRANAAWVRQHRMENQQAYAREQRLVRAQSKAVWRIPIGPHVRGMWVCYLTPRHGGPHRSQRQIERVA